MSDIQTSFTSISWPIAPQKGKALPKKSEAQPIPAKVGVGQRAGSTSTSGGALELSGPVTITSTDGVFSLTFANTGTFNASGVDYKVPVVA